MKVMHITTSLSCGGSARLCIDLLDTLVQKHQHQGTLVSLGGNESYFELPEHLQPFISINASPLWWHPLRVRRAVSRLERTIDDCKPDLIHTYLWYADWLTFKALKRRDIPHVIHWIDTRAWLDSRHLKHRWRKALYRKAVQHSHAVIACSHQVADYHLQTLSIDPGRILIIPNAVPVEAFKQLSPRPFRKQPLVIGAAGRFDPEKGHSDLFRAIAMLKKSGFHVELKLAGDGRLRQQYLTQIEQLKIADRVELLGNIDDMRAFFASLHVLVMPSTHAEGIPLTALSAMAAGVPVVASTCAGMEDVITHGVDGYIVKAGDPDDLTVRLKYIIQSPEDLSEIAAAGRRQIELTYSLQSAAQNIDDLYKKR